MKRTKRSGAYKIFIAIITILMIVCILSMLVACDDSTPNNNGNQNSTDNSSGNDNTQSGSENGGSQDISGNTGTNIGDSDENPDCKVSVSLNTLDSEQLNEAINGILGYLYAHSNNYKYAQMMGDYVLDNENGIVLFLTVFLQDNNNNEISCSFSFFKSEQDAAQKFDSIENRDELITKNKSVIIEESEQGFYNSVINSSLPQDATAKAQLKFYCNALKKELNDDCRQSSFTCEGAFDGLYIAALPKQGNICNIYDCCTAEFFAENREIWANTDLTLYTDDSYIKETDGIYYVYLQNKPGFVFEENGNGSGYIVDEFYYENEAPEHLIIPSSYNGKPVVGIYADRIPLKTTIVTIPASITTLQGYVLRYAEGLRVINYQGTIEQWNALEISEFDIEHIEVIHCTNGDIVLKQN